MPDWLRVGSSHIVVRRAAGASKLSFRRAWSEKGVVMPMQCVRVVICVAAVALLSGCVTARPVALPNGTQGYAIRCPGAARDISDCMNEAARVCGGKYQILDREGNVVGGAAVPAGNGAVWVQGIHRTLIVSCQSPGSTAQ